MDFHEFLSVHFSEMRHVTSINSIEFRVDIPSQENQCSLQHMCESSVELYIQGDADFYFICSEFQGSRAAVLLRFVVLPSLDVVFLLKKYIDKFRKLTLMKSRPHWFFLDGFWILDKTIVQDERTEFIYRGPFVLRNKKSRPNRVLSLDNYNDSSYANVCLISRDIQKITGHCIDNPTLARMMLGQVPIYVDFGSMKRVFEIR